jgi:hypothetical protein
LYLITTQIFNSFPISIKKGKNLNTKSDLDQYLNSVYVSVNLFKKSMENLRPNDHTSIVEFASFLYQMHSYCSRQIKLNKLISHFESDLIEESLARKKVEFLKLSLEIYKKASRPSSSAASNGSSSHVATRMDQQRPSSADLPASINDESASMSYADKNTGDGSHSRPSAIILDVGKHLGSGEDSGSGSSGGNNNEEEWLYQYMFGKIKEKLGYDLIECLNHYRLAYDYLEKCDATILKKCTYRSKSCLYIEINEVVYRMYALTLKRIQRIATRPGGGEAELQRISEFLENLTDTKFVKLHEDFDLENITMFLQENIFNKSKRLLNIEESDLFINIICICVAGLFQILRRFSQHYRSLYRLAHFYCSFLDFRVGSLIKINFLNF